MLRSKNRVVSTTCRMTGIPGLGRRYTSKIWSKNDLIKASSIAKWNRLDSVGKEKRTMVYTSRFYSNSSASGTKSSEKMNEKRQIEILSSGMQSLIQDFPGRLGLWRVGVPPSGPMDHLAFRIANALVGNPEDTAALELTFLGPTIKFPSDTRIALTGAKMSAMVDGVEVPFWKEVEIKSGGTLTLGGILGPGCRTYLAIAGGLNVPKYLGSSSTFPLGKLGGQHGRAVETGDVIPLGTGSRTSALMALPSELIPIYTNEWEIGVLPGPQEAPDYITTEDVEMFYSTKWRVSNNASRLGIRLEGPRPKWARPDGGEGGSHPSNLHDNAYSIGAINFTGDHPVILTLDGPSLGGFVCPATIPHCDLWKIGQVKPGDTIIFKKLTLDDALKSKEQLEDIIDKANHIHNKSNVKRKVKNKDLFHAREEMGPEGFFNVNGALIHRINEGIESPAVQYRLGGDSYILVEYGEVPVLDLKLRVRIHALEEKLKKQKINGLIDTIPGVRSLSVQYDNSKISIQDLMKILVNTEKQLDISSTKLPSRVFTLPLAFRDSATLAAIEKYAATIRSEAPYLPDNIDFMRRNNGLSSTEDVKRIIYEASYMVMGLGDVYLGAPCAVPVDPRHRLVVPKYNPARTYTPEGGVGIGGAYMCIYPMESPGGYQLIGRTLPIWNTKGDLQHFTPEKPWLLDMFDQIRFYEVSEDELIKQREAFSKGDLRLNIKDEQFDLESYDKFLKKIEPETKLLKIQQKNAQYLEMKRDEEMLKKQQLKELNRTKVLHYLGNMIVNGPNHPGAIGPEPARATPKIPKLANFTPATPHNSTEQPPRGLKQTFDEEGPENFAKKIRNHKNLLFTDTTWRDAHQSLLATRIRTIDLEQIAKPTSYILNKLYSLECWGGATFDVPLRFLHECPWDRLSRLRQLIPNIPFQMLLRGANGVGYTSYPDNVIYAFCKKSKEEGIDIFRIYDSLNYVENLKLGIDAVGQAGGVVEAAICYTGDVISKNEKKYTIEYYLNMARELVKLGIHVLCIKDMAGILKPQAAEFLISELRKEFPELPIHVHTHDTAGTGVASMLACARSGADIVDAANDALSGLTSQPSMGALIHSLQHTEFDSQIDPELFQHLTTYWEGARRLYSPFEPSQKSAGSDVYINEIPGGQYTNLQFQALSSGIGGEWDRIKQAYVEANEVLGNIVKVSRSSKVVGDLAQFMVANKLNKESVVEKAGELNFPSSVIEFLQGYLGIPYGGFPEPFTSRVLKDRKRVEGRYGASMTPFDFDGFNNKLERMYGVGNLSETDLLSAVQYPQVFDEFMKHKAVYGDVSYLPTRQFFTPLKEGEEFAYFDGGKERVSVKLLKVGRQVDAKGAFDVEFMVNGQNKFVNIKAKDTKKPSFIKRVEGNTKEDLGAQQREKVTKEKNGQVGSPMPGKVVKIHVAEGTEVKKGEPLLVLSAMKMETIVHAPRDGKEKTS